MNSADCAMIPGARNDRYGTWPVSMTRNRENVCPKISSHSAGCTILVSNSVRSCRSFCSSTIAKAPIRMAIPRTRCQPRGARTMPTCRSTDTAGRPSAVTDRAESGLRGVLLQSRTGVVTEDVFQSCLRSRVGGDMGVSRHPTLQLGGRTECPQPAVLQRHPVAECVGLLHIVRGEQDGHAEL